MTAPDDPSADDVRDCEGALRADDRGDDEQYDASSNSIRDRPVN